MAEYFPLKGDRKEGFGLIHQLPASSAIGHAEAFMEVRKRRGPQPRLRLS